MSYKVLLIDDLFASLGGRRARILDLGCGTAANFVAALQRYPNVAYTGVEQDAAALANAQATIGHLPNVELHDAFGESFPGKNYDLVISLSVLEHVKRLDGFLATSVRATKPGGRIVHRYDLGHALTPATWGERLRVAVARRIPGLVPESRFTTHPDLHAIVGRLRGLGVEGINVTQAQMPSLKAAINLLDPNEPLARQVAELDAALWDRLHTGLTPSQRDRLFPSVTISGYRSP